MFNNDDLCLSTDACVFQPLNRQKKIFIFITNMRLVLQLSLRNPLKLHAEWRISMKLERHRQGVLCEYKLWFMLYLNRGGNVCNIVLYWAAL